MSGLPSKCHTTFSHPFFLRSSWFWQLLKLFLFLIITVQVFFRYLQIGICLITFLRITLGLYISREEYQRDNGPSSSYHFKGIYYQHFFFFFWCWSWSPGWGGILSGFSTVKLLFSPLLYSKESYYVQTILRSRALCSTPLKVENSQKLFGFFFSFLEA